MYHKIGPLSARRVLPVITGVEIAHLLKIKAKPIDPAFILIQSIETAYFLNLLFTPTIPIRPDPSSHRAPGTGTGAGAATNQAP